MATLFVTVTFNVNGLNKKYIFLAQFWLHIWHTFALKEKLSVSLGICRHWFILKDGILILKRDFLYQIIKNISENLNSKLLNVIFSWKTFNNIFFRFRVNWPHPSKKSSLLWKREYNTFYKGLSIKQIFKCLVLIICLQKLNIAQNDDFFIEFTTFTTFYLFLLNKS